MLDDRDEIRSSPVVSTLFYRVERNAHGGYDLDKQGADRRSAGERDALLCKRQEKVKCHGY